MEHVISLITQTISSCFHEGGVFRTDGDTGISTIVVFGSSGAFRTSSANPVESVSAYTLIIGPNLVTEFTKRDTIFTFEFSSNWASVVALFDIGVSWAFHTVISVKIESWLAAFDFAFSVFKVKSIRASFNAFSIVGD